MITDTIVDGLPVATGDDGADPEAIEIIGKNTSNPSWINQAPECRFERLLVITAMGLAFNGEINESSDPGTLRALAMVRYGDQ